MNPFPSSGLCELMEGCRGVMAALSENVLTVSMLLSVFFLSGVQTGCDKNKVALNITAPKEMEALSGSCLLIPCSFREKPGEKLDGSRETFGVWIKSDPEFGKNQHNVIYNSSRTKNSYEVNITGNLRERNCTTVFSNVNSNQRDNYFFRIENGPLRATASCDPVHITVRDSAWSPRIEISGAVKEKNSVTITCSALTPCPHSPPELTWSLQPEPHRRMEENTDGTFTTKIQQSITLSDIRDGDNICCSARYPVDGGKHSKAAKTEVTLSVSYGPNNISASISSSAGSRVELDCSSRLGSSSSEPLIISLIAVAAVAALMFLVVWFIKSKHTAVQHNQTETAEEPVLQIPCHEKKEDLHYEDVNFIKKPSCVSESSSRQQQETLYAQVRVSEPENRSAQTADNPEVLYSVVQKHR